MKLYTSEEIRKADATYANNDFDRLIGLINKAGYGLFSALPNNIENICVVSGGGNNGADGLSAALYMSDYGYSVNVYVITKNGQYNKAVEHFINELQRNNVNISFI